MKIIIASISLSFVFTCVVSKPVETVTEQWFEQNLNHFNPNDNSTWQQRYFTNDQFYGKRDLVFLFIGEESPAVINAMTDWAWTHYAEKYGAMLFQLEHRYYGESHPVENLTTSNLIFLTSQQALADLATFIKAMNIKYNFPRDVKWIVFGGSYGGSLAAWLRLKYPHLVHGAVSSSAPLLAQVEFADYLRIVQESLASHSEACFTAVQQAVKEIRDLMNQEIKQSLNQIFKLCDPIQNSLKIPLDISNFYGVIAGTLAEIVQFNKVSSNPKSKPIEVFCNTMANHSIGPAVNRLGAYVNVMLDAKGEKCLDYRYQKNIDFLKNVTWGCEETSSISRQWMYQTCTEFGFYPTSKHDRLGFGDQFPIEFFVQQCMDIFGSIYDYNFLQRAINKTNNFYGGLDIKVSNVVFVHGSIDPWHVLGITETREETAPAIFIKGTSHGDDIDPPSSNDLPQLTAAREQISSIIGSWLHTPRFW